jgi:hypothetical protein
VIVRSLEATWLDVERRMRRGERFTDVEDAIDASDLEDDEKAALWLLGWSYVHPRAQRREALAHLEDLLARAPSTPSRPSRHLRVAPLRRASELALLRPGQAAGDGRRGRARRLRGPVSDR